MLPSNCLEPRSGPHVISHRSTRKYRADRSSRYLVPASTEQTDHSNHCSNRKYRADRSSRYLVLASTEQMDHFFIVSVLASTEQMGRLGIWYPSARSRRIIPSFQYLQVPSRWVVSVSGTRKFGADGSFWLLVPSSAEHHFVDAAITTR